MTDDDDQTIERLRATADRMDPVPDAVTELARAALYTRRIDEALAELVADSANETAAVARGEPMRLLSFTHGAVAIELQVQAEDGTAALRGLARAVTRSSAGSGAPSSQKQLRPGAPSGITSHRLLRFAELSAGAIPAVGRRPKSDGQAREPWLSRRRWRGSHRKP